MNKEKSRQREQRRKCDNKIRLDRQDRLAMQDVRMQTIKSVVLLNLIQIWVKDLIN